MRREFITWTDGHSAAYQTGRVAFASTLDGGDLYFAVPIVNGKLHEPAAFVYSPDDTSAARTVEDAPILSVAWSLIPDDEKRDSTL